MYILVGIEFLPSVVMPTKRHSAHAQTDYILCLLTIKTSPIPSAAAATVLFHGSTAYYVALVRKDPRLKCETATLPHLDCTLHFSCCATDVSSSRAAANHHQKVHESPFLRRNLQSVCEWARRPLPNADTEQHGTSEECIPFVCMHAVALPAAVRARVRCLIQHLRGGNVALAAMGTLGGCIKPIIT